MAALGAEVWRADLPDAENGIVVLGAPIGSAAFVEEHGRLRMENERRFLAQIERLPDPQCAWVMLSQSAVPRATHTLRTVPPTLAAPYAKAHDEAVWRCFCVVVGAEGLESDELARLISTLAGASGITPP